MASTKIDVREFCTFTNRMLEEIESDWRVGFITKAWSEDMKDEKTGGIGMVIWVFKDPVTINGEEEQVWIVHPKSHELYKQACGNPDNRWPMILNQAIEIP